MSGSISIFSASRIADEKRAQHISDTFPIETLHRELDSLVQRFCPYIDRFENTYHWSIIDD